MYLMETEEILKCQNLKRGKKESTVKDAGHTDAETRNGKEIML